MARKTLIKTTCACGTTTFIIKDTMAQCRNTQCARWIVPMQLV